jgi:membrane protease subunit (stomatin/prohibitin family)
LGDLFAGATGGSNSFAYSNGIFMEANKDDLAQQIKTYLEKRIRELRSASKTVISMSLADELTKLANLKNQGVLSDEEFQTAKNRLLNL